MTCESMAVIVDTRASNCKLIRPSRTTITAIDSQVIAQLTPRTLSDLALLVPNFSANKINGFNAGVLRDARVGNTDIIVYNEAPVAVLIDDFVMPSTQSQLLDPSMFRKSKSCADRRARCSQEHHGGASW